ncbi:MAG TPA: DUF5659 domain-containing protein [Candidatus Nitrosocosmicus sp.]|nr:DUF5659 domain-containing protein [Candidatus Nitrosocosmicus sp.]
MNNQLALNNYYSTSDLALAATISLFYPLESIDKTNPHKAEFLFKRDASLDQLIESYWRRELKVEPQTFFTQLKFIKNRLYSD